ncbi:hypothetical protein M413DRAFT_442180 [Hebeloma cylindrosporum]|uniref:Uncharacterized protein n=1 Tax=Hebeloma cylindrosporum TaxID=76867 RepID=A0A0C2Y6N6_HEBCY|nr:hypothetical protein M413DRAFT_442180 [Hebeloma cylindrosporum h7]
MSKRTIQAFPHSSYNPSVNPSIILFISTKKHFPTRPPRTTVPHLQSLPMPSATDVCLHTGLHAEISSTTSSRTSESGKTVLS